MNDIALPFIVAVGVGSGGVLVLVLVIAVVLVFADTSVPILCISNDVGRRPLFAFKGSRALL